jgi:hypothetical protein
VGVELANPAFEARSLPAFKKKGIIFMFCIPYSKRFVEACLIPDHTYLWSHLDVRGRGN